MAIIYSGTNDGYCQTTTNSTLAATRSGVASVVNSSNTNGFMVFYYIASGGRGGGLIYGLIRAFFEFDTSGISVAPSSATLKIKGVSSGTADVIAVRSEQSATLATGDFDNLYGASTQLAASDGSGAGTLASVSGLTYSAEIATWSTSAYNDIPLNATALADMASLDLFKVCVMEYDGDYLDIDTGTPTSLNNGCYYADDTAGNKDPYIDYTAGTAAVTDNAVFFGTNF